MCGIAGCIGPDAAEASRLVAGMLVRLRHRGPDGEGALQRAAPAGGNAIALGHRRLSIIDLSAAAAQPMTSADGRLHIILNGEIYNYIELRRELEALGHRFRTQSDTEVLLEAWGAWGSATLGRVVGMFAFALFDETRRVLVLARDPFAIKPLYYAHTADGLAFASEIPPLLALPGVSRAADPFALADFLTRSVNNHEGRTMFADVRELPGAHYAEVPLDHPRDCAPVRYWSPPATLVHDLSFRDAVERVRALLGDSVTLHLRSDVPVGLLLSGGQDSSSILALARQSLGGGPALHSFSYRGQDGSVDEGPWIAAARDAAHAVGHEVRLTSDEWAADLDTLVASQGEPFGSPVICAQRRLFKCAAEAGMKVVLEGQGADEYLAGYDRFLGARLASLLPAHPAAFARVAHGYRRGRRGWRRPVAEAVALRWPGLRALRRARPTTTLLDDGWLHSAGAAVSPLWRPRGPDVLREMLAASLRAPSIPWLMRYSDRNAMAFSIENRVPFLNPRVVEFVLGLPEEHFIAGDGRGKWMLREAMRGLVPDAIGERRDRIGFDVPVESWLARTPALADLLAASLEIPAVNREPAGVLHRAVREGRGLPRPRAMEAWRLVTLAAWARTFDVAFA